jgi:2-alkyl-3-oxoalkanoate reductase
MNKAKVLVTGASGFLGRRTVEILSERGFSVRALVRKTSTIGNLKRPGVEISFGDVTDIATLKPAFEGIDFVIHTAVDTTGTKEGAQRVTIWGTRNVLDLCASFPIQKLVYISSLSVYGLADCKDGQVIDEDAPLERYPERRGVYSWSKIEAEKLVRDCMKKSSVPAVCLRPGTIYGLGGKFFTPMMGFSFMNKLFLVIQNRGFFIPLVYLDNIVEAIFLVIINESRSKTVYNLVDTQTVDKKIYMDTFICVLYPKAFVLYIPYYLISLGVDLHERVFKALGKKPFLSNYRLISSQKPIIYDSSKIIKQLKWKPLVSFEEAVRNILRCQQ